MNACVSHICSSVCSNLQCYSYLSACPARLFLFIYFSRVFPSAILSLLDLGYLELCTTNTRVNMFFLFSFLFMVYIEKAPGYFLCLKIFLLFHLLSSQFYMFFFFNFIFFNLVLQDTNSLWKLFCNGIRKKTEACFIFRKITHTCLSNKKQKNLTYQDTKK